MLLVRTILGPSRIHGIGVMADEAVPAGAPIWRFEPAFDQVIPRARLPGLPAAFRAYLDTYGYASPEFPDAVVLSCDHAKFLNHAEDPNTEIEGRTTVTRRALAVGDEITCDYRIVVEGWTSFD